MERVECVTVHVLMNHSMGVVVCVAGSVLAGEYLDGSVSWIVEFEVSIGSRRFGGVDVWYQD